MKKAEAVAIFDSVSNVLGKEQKKEMIAVIAPKPTVQTAPFDMVFKYSAPIRTWRAWIAGKLEV